MQRQQSILDLTSMLMDLKENNASENCNQAIFEDIANCRKDGREKQTAVCDLHGTLIRSRNPFPYFMLLAFEIGSPLRPFLLLLCFPVFWLVQALVSHGAAMQMLVFITFWGLKASSVESLSKAVLAKFYLQDMHLHTFSAFIAFGTRYVITEVPRIMVEPFLREYLGVDCVIGTELQVSGEGSCTGFIDRSSGGLLIGIKKLEALKDVFGGRSSPDVGFGDEESDHLFMSWCKEAYRVNSSMAAPNVPRHHYPKPLVFHDGRLAVLPTPAMALAIFLWTPIGILLAVLRIIVAHMPYGYSYPLMAMLGFTVRVKGFPPTELSSKNKKKTGILFVCSHRTLLDPVFLAGVLKRKITAVTYSISRLSELLANINTVRLARSRDRDSHTMKRLLQTEDLVICPEGTTCREPYLLRFSPLFAEVSDYIVPVMMNARATLFHGTTARGWKWLDPFFFFMNPSPAYDVEFLELLPPEMTCAGGKSSIEVANYIQSELAKASGFERTDLTRRDKYRFLVGHDGSLEAIKNGSNSNLAQVKTRSC